MALPISDLTLATLSKGVGGNTWLRPDNSRWLRPDGSLWLKATAR
ncbi:hypothetical protein [Caulobacter phage RapA]|nr:hypothetical protein [Caulobacter phage RapA]